MSTKNKKDKSKNTNKKTEIKLLRVEETFYQLTVADCEKKIDRLRKHLENLDITNDEIKEQIRSLKEDKVDKAAAMTRSVGSADEKIYNLSEKIYELSREYFDVKSHGDATISDLEDKYKAMHDQLTAEIKFLKAQLNKIDEYPKIEEKLNFVNEQEEERKKDKEMEVKDAIQNMERRIKGDREVMRKEIERKMLRVSEEFTRSSTMRNAAYTQRLIRENIALEKEIKILESSWRSMDQHLKNQVARHKEVKATFPALNQKKRQLILVAQQKTNLIEELTEKFEKLRGAYVESLLYKNQYQGLIEYQLCAHYRHRELIKEAKKLGTNVHLLKTDCLKMGNEFDRNKREIENLKTIITLIRNTILKAINVLEVIPTQKLRQKCKIASEGISEEFEEELEEDVEIGAKTLMEQLYSILNYYRLHKISTSSLETASADNLLAQHSELCALSSDSLREAFKHGLSIAELADEESLSVEHTFEATLLQAFKIPIERLERCNLFDVEKGSTLYASLSESNPEIMSIEERPDDQDDFPMSSSSYSAISNEPEPKLESAPVKEEPAATTVPEMKLESKLEISLDEMPAGTIVDVEMPGDFEFDDEMEKADENQMRTDQESFRDSDAPMEEDEQGEELLSYYMLY